MIPTIDKPRLDSPAQLALETGYSVAWAPGSAQYLTGLEGWTGSAPIRRSKAELLGHHGSHQEPGLKDERLVSVSGHYVAASRGDAARFSEEIAAFLGDGDIGRFRVEDADLGLRWVNCYLAPGAVDVKWTGGVDVAYTVHLLCPDPRKYGVTTTSQPTGIPVPGSGLIYPLFGAPANGVLDIGRGGYDGRATLSNAGTADTGAVFTITGDLVPGFTITEIGTGRRLVWTDTLYTGQSLVLDANDGSVTLDGYNPEDTGLTVAEWSRLGRGASATWQFDSPGSTNASMTVAVTPAWW